MLSHASHALSSSTVTWNNQIVSNMHVQYDSVLDLSYVCANIVANEVNLFKVIFVSLLI